jgi:hypothetical protein
MKIYLSTEQNNGMQKSNIRTNEFILSNYFYPSFDLACHRTEREGRNTGCSLPLS